jgi:hypothetical protein
MLGYILRVYGHDLLEIVLFKKTNEQQTISFMQRNVLDAKKVREFHGPIFRQRMESIAVSSTPVLKYECGQVDDRSEELTGRAALIQ